jgi:hypothetical protein
VAEPVAPGDLDAENREGGRGSQACGSDVFPGREKKKRGPERHPNRTLEAPRLSSFSARRKHRTAQEDLCHAASRRGVAITHQGMFAKTLASRRMLRQQS